MNNKTGRLKELSAVGAILLLLSGCKSTLETDAIPSACLQVAGTWDLIAETDDSQCGGSGKQEKMVFSVTQEQCQLTNDTGVTGTIAGNEINWNAEPWSINGGEVSYSQASAHIEGKQITGSYNWEWSDGNHTCSGITKVNGTILAEGNSQQTEIRLLNPMLQPSEGSIAHTFSVQAANAKAVYLAGEMSDWQANMFKMKQEEPGNWSLTLYLQPGAWQYKFVVDGQWSYDRSNPQTTDDGYDGLNSIIVLGEELTELTANPNIAHGAVINSDFESKVLGENSPYAVYLPAGYAADSQKSYPLLVLLHGYGNDQQQWIRDGKIQNFMDNLINKGGIEPFIIVMPSGDKSQYIGKREVHIIDELLPYIRTQYRIKAGNSSTAISGVSMGGFGAFYLAQRHPDVFGLSVALSGYFDLRNYPDFNTENFSMTPALHLYCGTDDHLSFANNQEFVKLLKEGDIKFTYKSASGGHTWRYWNAISTEVLTLISDFFSKQV